MHRLSGEADHDCSCRNNRGMIFHSHLPAWTPLQSEMCSPLISHLQRCYSVSHWQINLWLFYLQQKPNEDSGASFPVSCPPSPFFSPEVKYAGNVYLPVNALDPSLQAQHQNNNGEHGLQENKGYVGRPVWKGGNRSCSWDENMKRLQPVVPAWGRARRNIKDLVREPRNGMEKSVKIQIRG